MTNNKRIIKGICGCFAGATAAIVSLVLKEIGYWPVSYYLEPFALTIIGLIAYFSLYYLVKGSKE